MSIATARQFFLWSCVQDETHLAVTEINSRLYLPRGRCPHRGCGADVRLLAFVKHDEGEPAVPCFNISDAKSEITVRGYYVPRVERKA